MSVMLSKMIQVRFYLPDRIPYQKGYEVTFSAKKFVYLHMYFYEKFD